MDFKSYLNGTFHIIFSIFAVSTEAVWSESFVMRALKFKEGMLLRHLAARLLNKVYDTFEIIM